MGGFDSVGEQEPVCYRESIMTDWNRRDYFRFLTSAFFIGAFTLLFLPFYAEILLAGVAAFAMGPLLSRFVKPMRFRWRPSVAITLVALFLLFALPISMVLYKGYAAFLEISKVGFQNTEFFQNLAALKVALVDFAQGALGKFGLEESVNLSEVLEQGLSRSAAVLMQFSSSLVAKVPGLLVSLFIYSASLYFFLAESHSIRRAFERWQLLTKEEASQFIQILQKSSYNMVFSSVFIGFLQATIVSVGAFIFEGGSFGVVWVITFFCSFIPVIGAGPVALVMGLFKLISGNYGQAIGFVVVAVIGGTTDNIIRPFLISSGEQDLHPVVSLLAIIGALMVFGMPGLFLGPVIASVAIKIIPTLYAAEK